MNRKCLLGLAVGLGLLSLTGCGGDGFGIVEGTITAKGKPLDAGVVTFFPANGTPVATNVLNGAYSVAGVPYGDYRLTVTPAVEPPQVTTSASGQPLKPGQADPSARAAPPKKTPSPIAEKYTLVDQSGLKCKVDRPKVDNPIALD